MKNKTFLRSALLLSTVSVFLATVTSSSPAFAGFQWLPPGGQAADAVTTTDSSAYPAPQVIEAPAPVPAKPAASAVMAPKAPTHTLPDLADEEGVVLSKASPAVATPAPAPAPAEAAQDKPVRGFADNVPLSVALRQILPADYGFSVAQDVSLGTLVSWRGGASWRQTLKDMLQPSGLTIKEQGQMVHVVHATDAPIAAAATPTPPASSLAPLPLAPVSPKPALQPEPAKPMPLTPAAVPERAAPTMGYLVPPADAVPLSSSSMMPMSSMGRDAVVDAWTANKGDNLRKTLESWCRRANVELSWQAEYDFPLMASVSLTGGFEEAVRGLLAGFQDAKPQPVGYLHNNQTAGQTVLVIQARGNNYSE